ncbi:MAG: histidine kinase, partial [Ferruginibacter sp.]
ITGKLIAPLVLLPFVENAFKHSLNNETGKAWITFDLKVTGNELFFKTENSYLLMNEKTNHGGMGLSNVKKRLHLVYPGRHNLQIKDRESVFTIDLKMQLNEKN